ncbi:LacI family DNA-binding transcriptional regulator [Bacteroidota bacterium]
MVKKNITIHDIAKELNITASTVSRALNDHPLISENTKERVREVVKKLNYQPNTVAANLRKGKANTIGLMIPRINRIFFANIISGIESVLNQEGYNIIITQSEESIEKEKSNIQTLINNRVRGIIISHSKTSKDGKHFQQIINNDIALVQFDRVFENINSNIVINDNKAGSYEVVNHLLNQGYKRIAYFGGPQFINIYKDRYQGYSSALKENHINLDKSIVFNNVLTKETGYNKMAELHSNKNLPEAVFAASDYSALGAILYCKDKGIKIPDEIGIVGFLNEPFCEFITPSLTSLNQFGVSMGESAARLCLEEIKNKDKHISKKVIIAPQLIIRESSNRRN